MAGDPVYWNPATGWQQWPAAPSVCCAPQPTFQSFACTATWPPAPPRFSDEDVERIAKRVAELLREPR